jgi:hypothetical protein
MVQQVVPPGNLAEHAANPAGRLVQKVAHGLRKPRDDADQYTKVGCGSAATALMLIVVCIGQNRKWSARRIAETARFRAPRPLAKRRLAIKLGRLLTFQIAVTRIRSIAWHGQDPCLCVEQEKRSLRTERTGFGAEAAPARLRHGNRPFCWILQGD